MRYTKFTNGRLCDNGKLWKEDLYVDNKKGVIVEKPKDSTEIKVVDLKGHILAPGFLDIQNNGLYGVNFSSVGRDSTAEDLIKFKRDYLDAMGKYVHTGVTSLCPTVVSSFPEVYHKMLPIFKRSRGSREADSLGAHLEGPFINLKKKGCHPPETFVTAKEGYEKFDEVYGDENLLENVCIVTAAPEIPGVVNLIPELKLRNITYSIGHTNADFDTALDAVSKGATMITHLYNAMPQPHHREVGVVGLITSPLAKNLPYFGIICDGVHVDPSMAVIAYRLSPERCILVTDAMHLIGLADGVYKWENQYIEKKGPRLYIKGTKTLAGSATTLPECVRNLMHWTGISLAEAVKTVTNNPARSINVQSQRGFLNVGCDADLVVLDSEGYLKQVYKLGQPLEAVDEHYTPKNAAVL